MAAVGPMTVDMPQDGSLPAAPARLAANPHTWRHFTDLVFIDPVQTPASAGPSQAAIAAAHRRNTLPSDRGCVKTRPPRNFMGPLTLGEVAIVDPEAI